MAHLGGDLRIRDEYFDNVVSLTEAYTYSELHVIRYRGRLWTTITPVKDLTLNVRLSAEPRLWTKPAGFGPYGPTATDAPPKQGMEWRYGIFDILNVKWANLGDQPLTLTIGRQDIMLGDNYDWWLVADGTPGDGSWTFFLDAVRLTYDAQDIKTKFDLIYIYQNAAADEWIPTLGEPRYEEKPRFPGTDHPITAQTEQGVVVYASNKSIKNTTLDGYFIYKQDNRVTFTRKGTPWIPGNNGDIFTLGAKVTGTPAEHWFYSVEGAYQFGEKGRSIPGGFEKRDLSAYGGKAKLSYLFKDQRKNELSLVGEFTSGDDPDTNDDEMFDLLWGRWPRWSESYIYSFGAETSGKIAQVNNVARFGPAWTLSPIKGITFSAMYNALFAPEKFPTRTPSPGRFSNDGHFRGHYVQALLKHQFNKHIQAHVWGEFIWEGDYYAQRDLMTFLRAEVMFTW